MRASLSNPVRWACLALALFAALPQGSQAAPYEETAKKHSWFSLSRPKKTNPSEQLAYANTLREAGSLRAATKQFRALVMTWPGSPEAPVAQLGLARTIDARGKPEDAFDEYQVLMDKYPGRFDYELVLRRQMDIALEVGERRRLKWFGLSGFKAPERAIPLLEKVLVNGPAWDRAAEAQYLIGAAYESSEQQDLAVGAYLLCEERYPDTPYAEQAAFGRTRSWFTLAGESPNDEATLEEAYASTTTFLQRHPKSAQADAVRAYQKDLFERRAKQAYDRAIFYDRLAHKPKAALRCYECLQRFFPTSRYAAEAESRVAELRAMKETQDEKAD